MCIYRFLEKTETGQVQTCPPVFNKTIYKVGNVFYNVKRNDYGLYRYIAKLNEDRSVYKDEY